MSQCEAICPVQGSYNAVSIKINNPKANVSDKMTHVNDNKDYNAVNLEINNPELQPKSTYSYPVYDTVVTADMANLKQIDVPVVPVAYKASIETIDVPEPYLTNTENEKKNIVFNGLSFKASTLKISEDANLKPAVNIDDVLGRLTSSDYDIQALQLKEIFLAAMKNKNEAIPYVTSAVFKELINIAETNDSSLKGPTEEQIELREKLIANKYIEQQLKAEGKSEDEIVLPYNLTNAEIAKAIELSELELSERNKEYSLLTLAALTKVYADEYEEKTGNVVPLTDLPGASSMVEALRKSTNTSVKLSAIDALVYINRPEYDDEITSILKIASSDTNSIVAQYAQLALISMQ